MADYLIKEETLTAIANSIRDNTNTVADIYPEEMPNQINEVYNKGFADGSSQPSAELPTPTISINSDTGVVTATVTSGSNSKSDTLELNTKAATTVTPGTSSKTAVSKGYYTTGAITVAGDADLTAANIKKGVNIFGVTGTYEEEAITGMLYVNGSSIQYNDIILSNDEVVKYGNNVIGRFTGDVPEGRTWNVETNILIQSNVNPDFKPKNGGMYAIGEGTIEFSVDYQIFYIPLKLLYSSSDNSLYARFPRTALTQTAVTTPSLKDYSHVSGGSFTIIVGYEV